MSNTIQTMEKYMPFLDEKYKAETTSAILDASPEIYRETESAGTILLPDMTLEGLANYSRSDGFVKGDMSITYTPYTFACDRGRMFTVDAFDDAETAAVAFGKLAGEFIANHVAPELDAYRYNKYTNIATVTTQYSNTIPTVENILAELDLGIETLDNAEVPDGERVLFMSSTAYNTLKKAAGIQSRISDAMFDRRVEYFDGIEIVKVPKSRMCTPIDLLNGIEDSTKVGGFAPAANACPIHFILMSKKAPIQIVKAAKIKIVTPEQNPDADAYKFGYRLYHDTFVSENKKKGIYVNFG